MVSQKRNWLALPPAKWKPNTRNAAALRCRPLTIQGSSLVVCCGCVTVFLSHLAIPTRRFAATTHRVQRGGATGAPGISHELCSSRGAKHSMQDRCLQREVGNRSAQDSGAIPALLVMNEIKWYQP